MKLLRSLAALSLALAVACQTTPNYDSTLAPGAPALLPVPDSEVPNFEPDWARREEILSSLERSLSWTRREYARQFFPIAGITHERALRSLERMRGILLDSSSADEFDERLRNEFQVYVSAGWDGRGGGVLFTGYCTPILEGSLEPSERYRFPLYAQPGDLIKGEQGEILGRDTHAGRFPYPSRKAIEAGHLLEGEGLELAWLASPLDAYIAHVNGSAFIRLPDGQLYRLGYAAKNGRTYSSLGRALIEDGQAPAAGMSIAAIRGWAEDTDEELVIEYLHLNDSYVFFQPIDGNPHGSLDVEVQAERSIATDKSLFPRGAACFATADLPTPDGPLRAFRQFLFDQDTGGAIRSAGRADLYMGIGEAAEDLAGRIHSEGQLYYLFLRE